jgi:hypothetical protein
MPKSKSLGDLDPWLVRAEHRRLGGLVTYDTKGLGRTDGGLQVWWHCKCKMQEHVTLRTCESAASKLHALRCYICNGDPPAHNMAIGGVDEGEVNLRALVAKMWPEEVVAVRVHPWPTCAKHVDLFFPLRNLIIEHDGASHFKPLPRDRVKGGKLPDDWDFVEKARRRGMKVLRLHYKDKDIFANIISHTLADCDNSIPVFSPSYDIWPTL